MNIFIKRAAYLFFFVIIWQIVYMTAIFPEILFPSPKAVGVAFYRDFQNNSLLLKTWNSLYLIFLGMFMSLLLTFILVVLSTISSVVKDLCKTLISLFDPLPGIALLPIAILWFGIGQAAIIFIMVHSILWPTLMSVLAGFDNTPRIYREVGANMALSKFRMVIYVYMPAAFPSILMGVKNGWARAWRALISAEMVFGATGVMGGLGWDIYMKRSYLDMPGMFATLFVIMLIGILIEDAFFKKVENHTVRKWGMVS